MPTVEARQTLFIFRAKCYCQARLSLTLNKTVATEIPPMNEDCSNKGVLRDVGLMLGEVVGLRVVGLRVVGLRVVGLSVVGLRVVGLKVGMGVGNVVGLDVGVLVGALVGFRVSPGAEV